MERVLIVGCPGAGKSTMARQLAEQLNLPLVHLDALFWLPDWKEREKDEFDALVLEELRKPQWIIDGNFGRTLSTRLQYCDTVIYLDFSSFACLRGVLKRVITTHGKVRLDMGAGCPERFDWAFLKYVRNFNKTTREKMLSRIAAADPSVTRIILRNRRQVTKLLKTIRECQ
ncbi:MAG: AAA family ATPase [Clostridia bacterium]|nr:AAA family ATPase [Clostridia bacterium]